MKGLKCYKVQEARGQLKVVIPKVLAQAIGIQRGDRVYWTMDGEELVLKKI